MASAQSQPLQDTLSSSSFATLSPLAESGRGVLLGGSQTHHAITHLPLRKGQNVDSQDTGKHEEGAQSGDSTMDVTRPMNGVPLSIQKTGHSQEEETVDDELMPNGARAEDEGDLTKTFEPIRSESTKTPGNVPGPTNGPLVSLPQPEASDGPIGRRSVQFARPASDCLPNEAVHRRSSSFNADGDVSIKDRRGVSLLSRLKALAATSTSLAHPRVHNESTIGPDTPADKLPARITNIVGESQQRPFLDSPVEENSEIDADGEESLGEESVDPAKVSKKRKKTRRPQPSAVQTAPTTPRTPFMREGRPRLFHSGHSDSPSRPSFLRRATVAEGERDVRHGLSEDEGRNHMTGNIRPWRRASGIRGRSYVGFRKGSTEGGATTDRPSHFKRALTSLATSGDASAGSPSPWRFRTDRTASLSAAKWRQIKAGLRAIGRTSKEKNTIDHAKSAELVAELLAGVPAALLLTSMFQRDEHGHKRIPVLLEQLKVKITDSKQVDSRSGDRHMVFRIELEYGNGLTRMKWVIHRALRDFANLHARYKIQIGAQKYIKLKDQEARTKLPHFPRGTFPYLRGIRGLDSDSEGEEEADRELTGPSGAESGADRPGKKKRMPSMGMMRRKSSVPEVEGMGPTSAAAKKDMHAEKQRKRLEIYLQQMIRYLIFRPESNRLCKFLELSALGVRLASEGSYHGKEGHLIIQSAKGVDFRRALNPSLFRARHGIKWFLVRHSYIVCVDSPEEMNIYDVFLVDSDFRLQAKKSRGLLRDQSAKDIAKAAKASAAHPQHHSLKIYNSERKLRLLAKNERQLHQFEDSIRFMVSQTPWAEKNRFDSFAPERTKVAAQWLVDGRDYMWNVSRAISMAKDVICIHDWWLSPEIYMRRPAAISQKWRLDRLLQRKAQEGVKIFVIMYRNINSAVPIDSEYSKFSLLDLHPNIFVQRSPNQMRQGTFFWAHHEKIVVVDHIIAFVGGIDLCFGRWDTPQHPVADDKSTGFEDDDFPKDADHCQLFPGKDYSNPRVQDFYALDKPYEEMYDRTKVPRMPWHDISMQVVGQPARDLTRHFVQRWNYIPSSAQTNSTDAVPRTSTRLQSWRT